MQTGSGSHSSKMSHWKKGSPGNTMVQQMKFRLGHSATEHWVIFQAVCRVGIQTLNRKIIYDSTRLLMEVPLRLLEFETRIHLTGAISWTETAFHKRKDENKMWPHCSASTKQRLFFSSWAQVILVWVGKIYIDLFLLLLHLDRFPLNFTLFVCLLKSATYDRTSPSQR